MVERLVRHELEGGIATVTLDRPPRNALSLRLVDQLVAALRHCEGDARVRAVILTGAGDKFCVGADLDDGPESLRTLVATDGGGMPGYQEPAGRVTAAIAELTIPVIAAINGDAVGGGATIALAADLRFAADTARFAFPFTRLGVCPEGASTYYLPQLVGPGVAADWLLSGRLVDSLEAQRTGLINAAAPKADVLSVARDWAAQVVARTAPAAVARTRAMLAARPATAAAASAAESSAIAELVADPDCPEGIAAFLERRAPRFGSRSTVSSEPNREGDLST